MYGLLIVYALIAIGCSFLCSVAEAVILSVTPSYVAALREQGKRAADRLEQLKENIDRPLAAILSLNTIAHTVGAAGVGAQAAEIWGSRAVGWASAGMTLLILVLSEIIPKTIGAAYWRPLAPQTARFVQLLIWLLYPLVLLAESLTRWISGGQKQYVITREEVAAMATLSAQEGELDTQESRIFSNLLRLRSLTVRDIMTPRTVILAFPREWTVGQALNQQDELPVSRLPIYEGSIDHVTGFVLKSDLLLAKARGEPDTVLSALQRDIRAVSYTASLSYLLDVLASQGAHIALVVDDYGGTEGLVTLEDLVETLLGLEIVDEADTAIDMQHLARERWAKRAERLGLNVPKRNLDETAVAEPMDIQLTSELGTDEVESR
jgi:CBS domain containing-hemolysin-like protein